MLLVGFAFIAGLVTVLSPCILPILPLVLSVSVGEGKRRPWGVVVGFVASFVFFTLFLASLVKWFGISADVLRHVSVVMIGLFGMSLLIPKTQVILESLFSSLSKYIPKKQRQGFGGGVLLGISLGLIWTPCVGPILASVIALALTGTVSGIAVVITLAYATGTAIPMLLIMYGSKGLMAKMPVLRQNSAKIQKVFGIVMIGVAVAIFLGWDRQFQTWILDRFPGYGTGLTAIEDNELVKNQLESLSGEGLEGGLLFEIQEAMNYPVAPELVGGTGWINSEPLKIHEELKGKVVLVDFWTYSCINCIRTLPYLTQWYEKYKDEGLVIVGVHAPEFEFEKERENVIEAMKDFGVLYPVVQDNEFRIWKAYENRYWPAKYLIDKQGRIVYTHFGEGAYQETEEKIVELLGAEVEIAVELDEKKRKQTPEIYLGFGRAQDYVAELRIAENEVAEYSFLETRSDEVGLRGKWRVEEERIIAEENGAELELNFLGQQVYLVMKTRENEGEVEVWLDGERVLETGDTQDGVIKVEKPRKYDVAESDYGRHQLRLVFDEGVSAYAFTFGS